jgi:hypothetical protein
MLKPQTVHLSFDPGPYRMAMGLIAQDPSELIELDDRYPAEMAERRRLLAERRDEVLIAEPGSEAAAAETLARLAAYLPVRFPEVFSRAGDAIENRVTGEIWDLAASGLHPLELAGRLVQEDLCLVQPTDAGPVLVGGVVCFPSRWSLREKMGKLLPDVHERVPFYGERLARPVDRFMVHVKPGKLAVRLNWSILDDPALFQVGGKFRSAVDPVVTAENAADVLYLRVERQSLSLLEASGFVLFGIRVHVYPLSRIVARPEVAARLAEAVRALPEAMGVYKSLLPFRTALLACLDARAACPSAA